MPRIFASASLIGSQVRYSASGTERGEANCSKHMGTGEVSQVFASTTCTGKGRVCENHSGCLREAIASITASWPENIGILRASANRLGHGNGYLILRHGMRAEPISSPPETRRRRSLGDPVRFGSVPDPRSY